jgi:hypothetical protein
MGLMLSSCAQDAMLADPSGSMVPTSTPKVGKLNAEIKYINFSEDMRSGSVFSYQLPQSWKKFYIDQWKKALIKTVTNSNRFEQDSPNKFTLSVTVMEMDTPIFNTSPKYFVAAQYQIKEAESGHIIYSKNIRTEGTLPWTLFQGSTVDTLPKVLILAVNNNIKEFIESIDRWDCPC